LGIAPQISYRSDQGDGTFDLVEASTEVVVQSGQPVMIGGSEGSAEVMRRLLVGYERVYQAGQGRIVLIAESQ
jgi:hypothetical protein